RIPLAVAGIDAAQTHAVEAGEAIAIPPGHAVLASDDRRVRTEERTRLRGARPRLVRFEADDHVVLRPERGRIVRGAGSAGFFLAVDQQLETVLLDLRQVGAARNQRELDLAEGAQSGSEIAADRARAVDADSHRPLPRLWFSGDFPELVLRRRAADVLLGGGDAGARLHRNADVAHRHLATGQCLQDHDLIDVAEMADAEDAAGDLGEAGAERHPIAVIGDFDHVLA